MAQQNINTGTNPNDGTGDNLRAAWIKQNAMNVELFAAVAALVANPPVAASPKDTS